MTWQGSKEKQWEWYKHTKPCNNILQNHYCQAEECNYAHTADQYLSAVTKRKFTYDMNIVNQLKLIELNNTDTNLPPRKRARIA